MVLYDTVPYLTFLDLNVSAKLDITRTLRTVPVLDYYKYLSYGASTVRTSTVLVRWYTEFVLY